MVRIDVAVRQSVRAGQVLAHLGNTAITSPINGLVTALRVSSGSGPVPANAPLVTLQYQGFGIQVAIDPKYAYRAYGKPLKGVASLSFGASGFGCALVPGERSPESSAVSESSAQAGDMASQAGGAAPGAPAADSSAPGPVFQCLIPTAISAFEGETAKVGIEYATVRGALVLPVSAVAGTAQSGTVRLVTGSLSKVVPVRLGVSDGSVVQIVSGLALGDMVAASPPELGDS
jgi:multidrug efflux pump subunit AcrA (membrane-fusion protein)